MTKSKVKYIATNIRNGIKASEAVEILMSGDFNSSTFDAIRSEDFSVTVISYDHSRDMYGNGTAHYSVDFNAVKDGKERFLFTIVESGKRREQVGYSGKNEAALYALDKLGYTVDTSKHSSRDYEGSASYKLLNFKLKGE